MPNNLTDTEIKKALKTLLELVLVEGCLQRAKTISLALDLINRLEGENESLKAEVERLQKLSKHHQILINELNCGIAEAKAEAYKEFAVKLLALIGSVELPNLELRRHINNLLNELVGDASAGKNK